MSHALFVLLFSLLLLPGLLMAFVPMLPASWYLIALATLFAFVDGFVHLTPINLAVLFLVFLLSVLVEWSAGFLGARIGGAGWKSVLYGAIGAVLGILAFPPLGALFGLFGGVFIGETLRSKPTNAALQSAAGALIGTVTGVVINACLALLLVVLFVLFALF